MHQPFVASLLRLGQREFQHLARDAGGAHVLEAFMKGGSKNKAKWRVMRHLEGMWGQLAQQPCGSHLVESCFDNAVSQQS